MQYSKIKHRKSLSQLNQKPRQNKVDAKKNMQSIRRMSLNPQYNKLKISKQKLVRQFQRDLDQKLLVDEKVKLKIYNEEKEKLLRKIKIQETLKQINKKNQQWIKKMNSFQKKIFNRKKQVQFQKDKKQEEQLLKQYNSVTEEKHKIEATKFYLSLIQKHDWNQIQTQKIKISQHIKKSLKKEFSIIKNKDSQYLSKIKAIKAQKLMQSQSQQDKPKIQRKKKNQSQRKAIGNQYLEQAKKLMQENVKSKIKMMDVNLKNIDYRAEIKEMVEFKSSDLSKTFYQKTEQQSNSQQNNQNKK